MDYANRGVTPWSISDIALWKKSLENAYLCNRGRRSCQPFTKGLDLWQIYNFYKKPKAPTTMYLLHVLEQLHDEHGDAERVPPPDPVADQGQPHWVQDFLSFVAK